MDYIALARQLNTEIKSALTTLYTALPAGQQRTVIKNEEVKKLLIRYGVIENG